MLSEVCGFEGAEQAASRPLGAAPCAFGRAAREGTLPKVCPLKALPATEKLPSEQPRYGQA